VNVSCPECRSIFRVDPTKVPSLGIRARCSVCGGVMTIGVGASIEEEFGSVGRPAPSARPQAPMRSEPAGPAANEMPSAPSHPALQEVSPIRPPVAVGDAREAKPPTAWPSAATTPAAPPVATSATPTRPAAPPAQPAPAVPSSQYDRPARFAPQAPRPSAPPSPAPPAARPTPASSRGPMPAAPRWPPTPAFSAPAVRAARATPPPTPALPRSVAPARPTPVRAPINPFLANDPNAKARRLARALVSDLVTYFPGRRDEGMREGTLKQLFRDEIRKSYDEYVLQVGEEFAEATTHFQDALNDILAGGQKIF
jgi:predicted Zn finger-like uncharacterized protein